jgi:uncharacterized protein (TIGR03083 family)
VFAFEDELRRERHRLIETLDDLSDEEFSSGPTLCAGWTPRDVLGHVVGLDDMTTYVRFGGRINAANEAMVQRARGLSRARLMEIAAGWANRPSLTSRMGAALLLGDLGIHHQDILRGSGRTRVMPEPVAGAILREGLQLSLWLNRRVLRHRVVPVDGGRPIGRGRVVHGTREALGLWLCGRDAVAADLEFA